MADLEIPEDLIELRRTFVAAQKRLSVEKRRQEWLDTQAECRELAVKIQGHTWWGGVDDRQKAEKALREAAG